MKVLWRGNFYDIPQSEVEEMIDYGMIGGTLKEYLQSGDIPEVDSNVQLVYLGKLE